MGLLLCVVLCRDRNPTEDEGAWKKDAVRTQIKVQEVLLADLLNAAGKAKQSGRNTLRVVSSRKQS